ncbi:uncharacterized protein amer3 [Brachyhypopomus gauderio]|uniref:uncharacterized protein amer3 n=1 Tax=Brachyhypopomus gauderio TaxID=698409 RepID=UPI00404386FF
MSKSQKQSSGGRSSPRTHTGKGESDTNGGHRSHSAPDPRTVTVNSADNAQCSLPVSKTLDLPSPELSVSLSESWSQVYGSVKKSRTHDCVLEMGLDGGISPGHGDCTWTRTKYQRPRLVNSASFSGFGATHMVLHENQNMSGSSREIIDYRNLTPQVPFVPSIAKSIPKKRIFLRKPRKAIKDLFVHKKDGSERPVSPCTLLNGGSEQGLTPKRTKKSSRRHYRARISKETNDMLSDSSSECCTNVCEDAVSLQSFGSQAGCGEIFADEDFFLSLEGTLKPELASSETLKQTPTITTFQGGEEKMVSPAQTEVLDLLGMWETLNKTILIGQNSSPGGNITSTPTVGSPSANKTVTLLEGPDVSLKSPETNIKEINVDMVTPKSDYQESTSDEGYYDYVSPEDQIKGSLTPVQSKKIPRDTYSGDALYELFYDPSEGEITPIFDDEMNLSPSLFGQSSDLPLSMYSFHVGAEENLAPPLAVDLISPEVLQSNWVGKECLLKLCDTEISLSMGIVNWLKQRNLKANPVGLGLANTSSMGGDMCQQDKAQSTEIENEIKNIPSSAVLDSAYNNEDMSDFKLRDTCLLNGHRTIDTSKHHERVVSTVKTPENQPGTPTNHVCFRLFNINSPLTPSRDLPSPVTHSPGSGTSSLFVLAINKESLCDSCKCSLRHGAKELHLCHSCISFIERIKTSELWARANLNQSKTAGTPFLRGGLLPSPSGSYGIASDISILSVVEQCATQVSSLTINAYQHLSDNDTRTTAEQGKDTQLKTRRAQKNLTSKHKKKGKTTATGGRFFGDDTNVKNSFKNTVHGSSLLEEQELGQVTAKTFESQCYPKMKPLNGGISQAPRPTSLPLLNATCEFSRKVPHRVMKVKEKPQERLHRPKKPVVIHDEPPDNVLPKEKKVERKRRMKK